MSINPKNLNGKTIQSARFASNSQSYIIIEFTDNSGVLIDAEYGYPLEVEELSKDSEWREK